MIEQELKQDKTPPVGAESPLLEFVRQITPAGRVPRVVGQRLLRWAKSDQTFHNIDPIQTIGPYEELGAETQAALRNTLKTIERYQVRGRYLGRAHGVLVRTLWEIAWGLSEKRARQLRKVADFIWYCPHQLTQFITRLFYQLEIELLKLPRASSVLLLSRIPLALFTVGYLREMKQEPKLTGYWHDEKRNITVASILGIDLIPTEHGFCVVECNLGPASTSVITDTYDKDPVATVFCPMTGELQKSNLWIMGPFEYGINPSLVKNLETERKNAQISLKVFEDPRLPRSRYRKLNLPHYQQRYYNPELTEPNTLLIRYRHFGSFSERLMHNKIDSLYALKLYKQRVGTDGYFLPYDQTPDLSAPVPTHVYKITHLDRGKGVFFIKAASDERARQLMRSALGGVSNSFLDEYGAFQSYVRPTLVDGKYVQTIRANVLLSPTGNRFLYTIRLKSGTPVPRELAEGVVKNPNMFLSNQAQGGSVERIPEQEDAVKACGLAVADAFQWAIEYGFKVVT